MLSKNKIHHLTSLQNKKFREQFCEFLIEGDKIVKESLVQKNFRLLEILAIPHWVEQNVILLEKCAKVPSPHFLHNAFSFVTSSACGINFKISPNGSLIKSPDKPAAIIILLCSSHHLVTLLNASLKN
jgi:hypothetical protein